MDKGRKSFNVTNKTVSLEWNMVIVYLIWINDHIALYYKNCYCYNGQRVCSSQTIIFHLNLAVLFDLQTI